jgi:hypothetical protein
MSNGGREVKNLMCNTILSKLKCFIVKLKTKKLIADINKRIKQIKKVNK